MGEDDPGEEPMNKEGEKSLIANDENANNNDMDDRERKFVALLLQAASEGNVEMLQLLIQSEHYHNEMKNATDDNGWTPLMMAACQGHDAAVELLLQHKADHAVTDHSGRTAIMLASCFGYPDTVKILLKHGASIAMQDDHGETALTIAVQEEQPGVIQLLLDATANRQIANAASISDGSSQPILMSWAIGIHPNQMMEFLLNRQVDRQIAAHCGWTPLSFAARTGNTDLVTALLMEHNDSDMSVNQTDEDGATAFMYAAREGFFQILQHLLQYGADLTLADAEGDTALLYAALGGHANVIDYLLANGAYIDTIDQNGWTALMYASEEGHFEAVQSLLKKGNADVSTLDHSGDSACSLAQKAGHPAIVKALLKKGAEITVPMFMTTCYKGQADILKLLLDYGGDDLITSMKDKNGKTGLMWAARWGQPSTVDLLLERAGDMAVILNQQDDWGMTALMSACEGNFLEIVKILLDQGADPNIANEEEQTALTLALEKEFLQIVTLLMERDAIKATKDGKDDDG